MGTENVVQSALAQFEGLRIRGDATSNAGKYTGMAKVEQVVRLCAAGMTMTEVAKSMKISYQHLAMVMRREGVMEKIKELNADMYAEIDAELAFRAKATHEKLYQAADEALDKVIDLMRNADSEVVQGKMAQDLLDRRPDTSKVHRVDKRTVNVNIDAKWLEQAAAVEAEEGRTING